jgi:hypothetical protein
LSHGELVGQSASGATNSALHLSVSRDLMSGSHSAAIETATRRPMPPLSSLQGPLVLLSDSPPARPSVRVAASSSAFTLLLPSPSPTASS